MQLHHPHFLEQLAALSGQLLVFSFAPLDRLQSWVPHFRANILLPYYDEHNLAQPADPFARTDFLSDPTLSAYHAYGLDRNSLKEVYDLKILRQYARWKKQGKPIHLPQEDPLQRGGNFVINRAKRLTLSHTGRDQSERPTVEEILGGMRDE